MSKNWLCLHKAHTALPCPASSTSTIFPVIKQQRHQRVQLPMQEGSGYTLGPIGRPSLCYCHLLRLLKLSTLPPPPNVPRGLTLTGGRAILDLSPPPAASLALAWPAPLRPTRHDLDSCASPPSARPHSHRWPRHPWPEPPRCVVGSRLARLP